MYQAVTRKIEVNVTPRFLPERSSPEKSYFFWAYTIEITNLGDETVQLKTRHWSITDAFGGSRRSRGRRRRRRAGAQARRSLRIYQRRAAADAVRVHDRHLWDGAAGRRNVRHRNSRFLARQS